MQWERTHVLGQVLIEKKGYPNWKEKAKKKKEYFTTSQGTGSKKKMDTCLHWEKKLNWIDDEENVFLLRSNVHAWHW